MHAECCFSRDRGMLGSSRVGIDFPEHYITIFFGLYYINF